MKIGLISLTACLAAALPGLLPAAGKNVVAFPADAAGILKVLHGQASATATEAAELASVAHYNNADLETHAVKLDALKDDINTMAVTLAHLESVRDSADATQQAACDRALVLLKKMADETRAAIGMLRENGSSFWRPDYEHHIDALDSASSRLSTSLKEVVQLAEVRAREKHIEKTLSSEAGF